MQKTRTKPNPAAIGDALSSALGALSPATAMAPAPQRGPGPKRRANRIGRVALEAFLPASMNKALKLYAVEHDRTLQSLIEEAIGDLLVKTGAQRHAARH